MKHTFFVFVLVFVMGMIGLVEGKAQENLGSLVLLSSNENVRRELKLTSLQEAVLKSIRQEYKTDVHRIVGGPLTSRADRRAALKQLTDVDDRYNRRILSTLNSKQKKTLRAIEHRVLGGYMLTSPAVQSALGLTARQKQKITAIQKRLLSYVEKVNLKFEQGRIDQFDRLRLLKLYRKATAVRMENVLTKNQLSEFKKMKNEN